MWNLIKDNGFAKFSSPIHDIDPNKVNRDFLEFQKNANHRQVVLNLERHPSASFEFRTIDIENLYQAFLKIKSNSMGCDLIPMKFLKIIFPLVDSVILHVINTMIMSSEFPKLWKIARVVPIAINNDKNSLRPISVLPCISKIAENVLKSQIINYTDKYSPIADFQSGFRDNHSCTSLLISLTDSIRMGLNFNMHPVLVSLDLTKAFDRINHNNLINKLNKMFQFEPTAWRLLLSYLSDRMQFVSINNQNSDVMPTNMGVPQGSILGPLLFILYLNDVINVVDSSCCKTFAYADDVQLLFTKTVVTLKDYEDQINVNIARILKWLDDNDLSINQNKTQAILFKRHRRCPTDQLNLFIGSHPISQAAEINCLGIIIDDALTFESHIRWITSKTNFQLKKLYNSCIFLPFHIKRQVAHALLISKITYGIEVYSGTDSTHKHSIKMLFNKVVRYLYNVPIRDHISDHMRGFLGCSFEDFLSYKLL